VAQLTYGDPDGYGRHGILQEGPAGFVCHECGRDDIAHLGLHAYRAHGITAAEYRARHGLQRRARLVTAAIHDTIRTNAIARMTDPAGKNFVTARDPSKATAARLAQKPQWRPAAAAAVAAAATVRGPKMRKGRVVVCAGCGAYFCPLTAGARRTYCTKSCARRNRRRQPQPTGTAHGTWKGAAHLFTRLVARHN